MDLKDEDYELSDVESEEEADESMETSETPVAAPSGGVSKKSPALWNVTDGLDETETLRYDPTAYGLFQTVNFTWASLSFDFLKDDLGSLRTRYPTSMYVVSGSQADEAKNNSLTVCKIENLHRTTKSQGRADRDSDDEESSSEEEDEDESMGGGRKKVSKRPVFTERTIKHMGCVNRVRASRRRRNVLASWSDTGRVFVWDVQEQLNSLDDPTTFKKKDIKFTHPVYVDKSHSDEGFALDFSHLSDSLVSGSCDGVIHAYEVETSRVVQGARNYVSHEGSVEDLQWSPSEPTVFSSCGVDGTVRIWDTRSGDPHAMLTKMIKSNDVDVNVLAWNPKVGYLLAAGCDDGNFQVFDLRSFESDRAVVGDFSYHKKPITSIAWHPSDESVLCVSSEDDQTTVWDLALEEDTEYLKTGLSHSVSDKMGKTIQLPPQLLFSHRGQREPKEVRFHPQLPGVIGVTGIDGFDVFLCEPLDPKTKVLNCKTSTPTCTSRSEQRADERDSVRTQTHSISREYEGPRSCRFAADRKHRHFGTIFLTFVAPNAS